MKKKLITLVAAFVLVSTSIFANTASNPVPASVQSAFRQNFHHVSQVLWDSFGNYYKATVSDKSNTMYVFYSENAELMGMGRNVLSDRLPEILQTEIKNRFQEYWITDLVQYKVADKDGYLITVENADRKIVLKSEDNRHWQIYSKENKI
jgi:hypothetical protein